MSFKHVTISDIVSNTGSIFVVSYSDMNKLKQMTREEFEVAFADSLEMYECKEINRSYYEVEFNNSLHPHMLKFFNSHNVVKQYHVETTVDDLDVYIVV